LCYPFFVFAIERAYLKLRHCHFPAISLMINPPLFKFNTFLRIFLTDLAKFATFPNLCICKHKSSIKTTFAGVYIKLLPVLTWGVG
jgi:hypothetical protein